MQINMKSIYIFLSIIDGNYQIELYDLCYNCNFKFFGVFFDYNKKDCVFLCGFNWMLLKLGIGSEEWGMGV